MHFFIFTPNINTTTHISSNIRTKRRNIMFHISITTYLHLICEKKILSRKSLISSLSLFLQLKELIEECFFLKKKALPFNDFLNLLKILQRGNRNCILENLFKLTSYSGLKVGKILHCLRKFTKNPRFYCIFLGL